MNCKQGDLAVVVRSLAGNDGVIVRCIQLMPAGTDDLSVFLGPVWKIDKPLVSNWGDSSPFINDINLRPIRDNDGEDETLTWAGKPEQVSKPSGVLA